MRSSSSNALSLAFNNFKAALKPDSNPSNKPPKDSAVMYAMTQDDYSGHPPPRNATFLADLYNNNPWARTIVAKISEAVAKQRWYLEDEKGERIDKHPALDFIRAGCQRLRGRRALSATQTLIELQGECFWIVGRNADGAPMGFAPIPAHWVLDLPGKTFKGYRIQPRSGAAIVVGPEDVIHFRQANPNDPYGRGSSLANAARVELESDDAAANYLNSYFANRARPDYVITGSVNAPLDEVSAARLDETLTEKFRGAKRAGRPLISLNEIKVTPIGSGLRDNQTVEVRTLSKANIAEIWNMPPELLGRLDSSNKATITDAENLFLTHLIEPRLSFLEDFIQAFALENFELDGLELRFETPVKDDLEFSKSVMQAFPGAFSDNEKRALLKMKPVEGRDDLPEPVDPNAGGDEDDDIGKKKPKKADEKAGAETRISAAFKALTFDDVVTVSGATEDPQVRAEVSKIFDEIIAAAISKFGTELLQTLESDADFQVYGEVAQFIAAETPDLIGKIDATTKKELLAALTEGVAAGDDVKALIARVEKIFEEAARVRSSTIGDTVATKIAGFASQAAAEQGGFSQKKWLSTRDAHVRDTHRGLDGQIVRTNGKFRSTSGAEAEHPGAFGVASEDINCRCAMRPLLEGEKAVRITDADYEAFYEGLRGAAAKRIANAAKTVFNGQKAVVIEMLKRVGGYRE